MNNWFAKNRQLILLVTAIVFCLSLLMGVFLYIYLSTFTRVILDDFCMGQTLIEKGFWESQRWWYMNWDGRYTFTFLIHLSVWLGPLIHRFTPALVGLLFMGFSLGNTFLLLPTKLRFTSKLIVSALTSSALLFFTLRLIPDVSESFYWVSAMLTYFLPLTFFLGGLFVINYFRRVKLAKWYHYVLILLLFFVSSGSSETFSIIQIIVLSSIVIVLSIKKPKKFNLLRKFFLVAIAAAVIGTMLMFLAPGNKVRQSYFPSKPSILATVDVSIDKSVEFVTKLVLDNKYSFLTIFIVGYIVSLICFTKIDNKLYSYTYIVIVLGMIIFVTFSSSIYVTGADPPNRVMIIPVFFIVLFVIFSGYLIGLSSESIKNTYIKHFILMTLILIVPILILKGVKPTINYLRSDVHGYRQYSVAFDRFDSELRLKSGSNQDLIIKKFTAVNGHQAAQIEDPNHWINKCISGYYQVKSVRFE